MTAMGRRRRSTFALAACAIARWGCGAEKLLGGLEFQVTKAKWFELDPNAQDGLQDGIATLAHVERDAVVLTSFAVDVNSSEVMLEFNITATNRTAAAVETSTSEAPTTTDGATTTTYLNTSSTLAGISTTFVPAVGPADAASIADVIENLQQVTLASASRVLSEKLDRRTGDGVYMVSVQRLWFADEATFLDPDGERNELLAVVTAGAMRWAFVRSWLWCGLLLGALSC